MIKLILRPHSNGNLFPLDTWLAESDAPLNVTTVLGEEGGTFDLRIPGKTQDYVLTLDVGTAQRLSLELDKFIDADTEYQQEYATEPSQ